MPENIFAIETSCDETSAAILSGNIVLSNVISSQLFHSEYGGIVPELASRAHIKIIDRIVKEAIEKGGVSKDQIGLVAATQGPGLIGSLLVGYNFAKSFAVALGVPFMGINHIESHLYSCFIGKESAPAPFIALVVSGGHTILFLVEDHFKYRLLGQTQDDAAGEAFDKVAKMMGLDYPGGPLIDSLAKTGNENFHEFPVSHIKDSKYDFSFSGIKTSVLYFLKKHYSEPNAKIPLNDLSASFQKAVVKDLVEKSLKAAEDFSVNNIAVSGGVSANSKLRQEFEKLGSKGINVFFPEPKYSTDNAAMIGYTAYLKLRFSPGSTENELTEKELTDEPAFARFDFEQINSSY
jgi:N6-L-threonylcarbamoyladenine synthase